MLLFSVTPRSTTWCFFDRVRRMEGEILIPEDAFLSVERRLGGLRDIGPVGYILYHGGELITDPVSPVTPDSLLAIQKCSRFLPEYNDALGKVARLGLTLLPDSPHLLLCDTAFFRDLPEHVHTYAVPLSIKEPSLRRYGGFGLCHEWVWAEVHRTVPFPPGRIVSVYLGENTNVAAIRNGRPVETSIGFTPVEGISSARSCGDIDPTVVFQIQSSGLSFSEIFRLLAEQSGFSGFLGRECTVGAIAGADERDPELFRMKDFLAYQIKKYVGAFVAALGGIDAAIFVTEEADVYAGLIRILACDLGFLPAWIGPSEEFAEGILRLSAPDSPVPIYSLAYDKWRALGRRVEEFLKARPSGT